MDDMMKNGKEGQTRKKKSKAITIIGQPPHVIEMDWAEKLMVCMIFECTLESHMSELIDMGYTTLYVSMNSLEEILLGNIVMKIKAEHPHIHLIGALEYEGVHSSWHESYQERYYQLIDKCDEVVDLSRYYQNDCEEQY